MRIIRESGTQLDTPGRAQSSGTWGGGMPETFGASTMADYSYSIYCSYSPLASVKTIGNTETYPSVSTAPNRRAVPVTFNTEGMIESISIYHNGGAGRVLMGVYADLAGLPSEQMGKTASTVINSTAGWQTVSLTSPVPVKEGETVWLSWVFEKQPWNSVFNRKTRQGTISSNMDGRYSRDIWGIYHGRLQLFDLLLIFTKYKC